MGISKREKEVLKLLSEGMTLREIAHQLFISYHTVVSHRKNICEKVGARTMVQMMHRATQMGLFVMFFAVYAAAQDTIRIPCGYSLSILDNCGDVDMDGWCIQEDNCPVVANPDQANMDGDNRGDICDEDRDGDGLDNDVDCDPDDNSVVVRDEDGAHCSDGDPCTTMDQVVSCACVGTPLPDYDSDGTCDNIDTDDDDDGVPDASDCARLDDQVSCTIGAPCDDSDSDTVDDSWVCGSVWIGSGTEPEEGGAPEDYAPTCVCRGLLDTDGDSIADIYDDDDDNDGVVDTLDCSRTDPAVYAGAPCDDGDGCTSTDTYVNIEEPDGDGGTYLICECVGTGGPDYDGDGQEDACDVKRDYLTTSAAAYDAAPDGLVEITLAERDDIVAYLADQVLMYPPIGGNPVSYFIDDNTFHNENPVAAGHYPVLFEIDSEALVNAELKRGSSRITGPFNTIMNFPNVSGTGLKYFVVKGDFYSSASVYYAMYTGDNAVKSRYLSNGSFHANGNTTSMSFTQNYRMHFFAHHTTLKQWP